MKNLKKLSALVLAGALVFSLAVLLVPSFSHAFSFAEMGCEQWLTVAGLALVPLVVVEIFKALKWNGK